MLIHRPWRWMGGACGRNVTRMDLPRERVDGDHARGGGGAAGALPRFAHGKQRQARHMAAG